jgi:hypothetical protein
MLHARPYAAVVDGVDPIERRRGFVGGVADGTWIPALLNAMSRRP